MRLPPSTEAGSFRHKYLLNDGPTNPVQMWNDYAYCMKREAQAELASGRWTSEFSHQALKPVMDFISQPKGPAEIAARQIRRPEGEPHPTMPAYLWSNASQCYVLGHADL